jgi:hypothetical protein
MGGDLLLPAGGWRFPALPGRPGIRPAISMITAITATSGPNVGPAGLRPVDPHPSTRPALANRCLTIGKRTGQPDGSRAPMRGHAEAHVLCLSSDD